jgi:hypothetical protein
VAHKQERWKLKQERWKLNQYWCGRESPINEDGRDTTVDGSSYEESGLTCRG